MHRTIRFRMVVLTLALAIGSPTGLTASYAQTQGSEKRQDRREDRGDAQDTRQTGRDDARDAKAECKAGDEKTRAECRQEKRDTKQDARDSARDKKGVSRRDRRASKVAGCPHTCFERLHPDRHWLGPDVDSSD
jgi:hypothetical protein